MADPMLIDDEDYASDQDSDFAPDAALQDDASDASDSENDGANTLKKLATAATTTAAKTQKHDGSTAPEDVDTGDFENSGDEAIIQKGHKRQRKDKAKRTGEDDEGGEGGLIKTRSMRAAEKAERKTHVVSGPVTVNVDDLWAQMMAGPTMPSKKTEEEEEAAAAVAAAAAANGDKENQEPKSQEEAGQSDKAKPTKSKEETATIKIKRTYNFAGKVHTEEKIVSRDSAEARLYLASLDPKEAAAILAASAKENGETPEDAAGEGEDRAAQPRKPRKAFRSIFEPVVAENMANRRADLNLGLSATLQLREDQAAAARAKTKKINVVEKSRMDWAGFVDQEGIKDELELAGRSKESYAHRQDFLSRVEANREEDARKARLAGRG